MIIHTCEFFYESYVSDQFETFVDICFNTSKTDDKTIHLIYTKKNEGMYEACQCNIKGVFSMKLNDIRFKSTQSDKCSQATLTVHNQTYGCDDETSGYGSVFGRSIGEGLSDETVVVTFDPTTLGPEMAYISITPTGMSICTGQLYPSLSCIGREIPSGNMV